MRRATLLATLTIVAAAITAACTDDAAHTLGPEGLPVVDPQFHHDPGHTKGGDGGGGGSSGPIQIRMAGGFYTASDQPAAIVSDNRNRTELSHDCFGTDLPGCMDYGIDFASVVGDLSACSTDPADMDAATRAELEGQLDDPVQTRVFYAVVYKKSEPKTFVKGIYQDDTNGRRYEIRYSDASADQDLQNPDHYTIGGGTIATWTNRDGVGLVLRCPVAGEAFELTVLR